MDDEGELLFEYRPLPMEPLLLATLVVLGLATFVTGPLLAPPDLFPAGGLWFAPFAAVLLLAFLLKPGPTRVTTDGIEPSRPLYRRFTRRRAFHAYADMLDVYPDTYEIPGGFLSPFASSEGRLVHRGLAYDLRGGGTVTLQFTPGLLLFGQEESEGYRRAITAVREALGRRGRPLVLRPPRYSPEEIERMRAEARRPLLSIGWTLSAFLLPPAILALANEGANRMGWTDAWVRVVIFVVALSPPIAAVLLTRRRGLRRRALLNEVAKALETPAAPTNP